MNATLRGFDDFGDALAFFRDAGGAMNYTPATRRGERDLWFVLDCDELIEQGVSDPKRATEIALARGGLTQKQIDAELADWKD